MRDTQAARPSPLSVPCPHRSGTLVICRCCLPNLRMCEESCLHRLGAPRLSSLVVFTLRRASPPPRPPSLAAPSSATLRPSGLGRRRELFQTSPALRLSLSLCRLRRRRDRHSERFEREQPRLPGQAAHLRRRARAPSAVRAERRAERRRRGRDVEGGGQGAAHRQVTDA
eukprot:6200442-Pleurochrysis_carterae.AAC.3